MAKIERKSIGDVPHNLPLQAKSASVDFLLPEGKDLPKASGAGSKKSSDVLFSKENYAKINAIAQRLGQPILSLSPSAAFAFFRHNPKMEAQATEFLRDLFLSLKQ